MKKGSFSGVYRLLVGVFGALLLANTVGAQNPSVVGTYKLTSRQFPDGTIKQAPEVTGLLTFTKTHRNLNLVWTGANNILCTYSLATTYKLTSDKYTEKVLFSSLNDYVPGEAVGYDLVTKTQTVRIVTGEGTAQGQPPLDSPTMVVDGDRIISTAEGAFVDVWEKVVDGSAMRASDPQ